MIFFCADLFYNQSAVNPVAYSRQSYDELYGSKEDIFRQAIVNGLPPLTRFDGIEALASFGPMSHFLDQRTEVTYGYGPLKISRYADFVAAMQSNPALRKDLNVSRWLDGRTGEVHVLADPLPRANFPKELVTVSTHHGKQAAASWLGSRASGAGSTGDFRHSAG